jgi:DNA-binding response OmpR family regulator
MVINDTQEILELFRDLLTEEGYEVSIYSYGVHDMKEVERVAPDLIIIDYLIGDEQTGWQMLQKLKMTRATAGIPIIVCTAALNQVKEIEGWLTQKGITVVLKPFDVDDLLAAVARVLAGAGAAPDPKQ